MSGFVGEMGGYLVQILGIAQGAAGGGLPALLAQLENAGLSERVRSWIGHGDNLPVTAAELERAFTPDQLNDWSARTGTPPDMLLDMLSNELPAAIDRATPAVNPRSTDCEWKTPKCARKREFWQPLCYRKRRRCIRRAGRGDAE